MFHLLYVSNAFLDGNLFLAVSSHQVWYFYSLNPFKNLNFIIKI